MRKVMPLAFCLSLLSWTAQAQTAPPAAQPAPPAAQPTAQPTAQPSAPPAAQPMAPPAAQPTASPKPQPAPAQSTAPKRKSSKVRTISGRNNRGRLAQANAHGIGFTAGDATGAGVSYRHYFGRTAVQLNFLPIIEERGDSVMLNGGVQVIRYLFYWQNNNRYSLRPNVALRISGSASFWQDTRSSNVSRPIDPTCFDTSSSSCPTERTTTREMFAGGGIGFEFGKVFSHGLSFAVDLNMRAKLDVNDGFKLVEFIPMPSASVMFNW